MQHTKTKVVAVGGGNGSAIALDALKCFADRLDISAVVSMSDSGASSGAMRRAFGALPPGDIMRAVLGMSAYPYPMLKKIFYKNRIGSLSKLNNRLQASRHPNLGNVFLLLASQFEGDFGAAVRALEEAVEAVGHAYPATLDQSDLCVELLNGAIICGEDQIDRPSYDRAQTIKRAWLEPKVAAGKEAIAALGQADFIVLAPGSLYTSVVAALLPSGIREAIAASAARLLYVVGDAYELIGETGPTRLSEFVNQLENYLPRPVDVVVYNSARLNARQKKLYRERQWGIFEKDIENIAGRKLVGADFESSSGGLNPEKLALVLKKLILK